jgi:hypothetical protein
MKRYILLAFISLHSVCIQAQDGNFSTDTLFKKFKKIEFKDGAIIIYSKNIVKKLGRLIGLGDSGMAIGFYPVIFVRPDLKKHPVYEELLRHEMIHMRQERELLVVGAWLLFGVEYLYARYIKKLDKRQAYYFTAMEQEAHRNAMKSDYLEKRKLFAIFKYIFHKKWLARSPTGELIEKDYNK